VTEKTDVIRSKPRKCHGSRTCQGCRGRLARHCPPARAHKRERTLLEPRGRGGFDVLLQATQEVSAAEIVVEHINGPPALDLWRRRSPLSNNENALPLLWDWLERLSASGSSRGDIGGGNHSRQIDGEHTSSSGQTSRIQPALN